jgi:hypothetical protein
MGKKLTSNNIHSNESWNYEDTWKHEILWSIAGAVLTIVLSKSWLKQDWIESIGLSFLTGTIILITIKYFNLSKIQKNIILQFRDSSKALSIYEFFERNNERKPYDSFLLGILKELQTNGAYLLYEINSKEYSDKIIEVFESPGITCYHCTLSDYYLPHWWFHNKDKDSKMFPKSEKLGYLNLINSLANRLTSSFRIMIFTREEIIKSFGKMSKEEILDFLFKFHESIQLYWIDTNEVSNSKKVIIHSFDNDFGVFNKHLIIKRIKEEKLEISSSNSSRKILGFFDFFDEMRIIQDPSINQFFDVYRIFKELAINNTCEGDFQKEDVQKYHNFNLGYKKRNRLIKLINEYEKDTNNQSSIK